MDNLLGPTLSGSTLAGLAGHGGLEIPSVAAQAMTGTVKVIKGGGLFNSTIACGTGVSSKYSNIATSLFSRGIEIAADTYTYLGSSISSALSGTYAATTSFAADTASAASSAASAASSAAASAATTGGQAVYGTAGSILQTANQYFTHAYTSTAELASRAVTAAEPATTWVSSFVVNPTAPAAGSVGPQVISNANSNLATLSTGSSLGSRLIFSLSEMQHSLYEGLQGNFYTSQLVQNTSLFNAAASVATIFCATTSITVPITEFLSASLSRYRESRKDNLENRDVELKIKEEADSEKYAQMARDHAKKLKAKAEVCEKKGNRSVVSLTGAAKTVICGLPVVAVLPQIGVPLALALTAAGLVTRFALNHLDTNRNLAMRDAYNHKAASFNVIAQKADTRKQLQARTTELRNANKKLSKQQNKKTQLIKQIQQQRAKIVKDNSDIVEQQRAIKTLEDTTTEAQAKAEEAITKAQAEVEEARAQVEQEKEKCRSMKEKTKGQLERMHRRCTAREVKALDKIETMGKECKAREEEARVEVEKREEKCTVAWGKLKKGQQILKQKLGHVGNEKARVPQLREHLEHLTQKLGHVGNEKARVPQLREHLTQKEKYNILYQVVKRQSLSLIAEQQEVDAQAEQTRQEFDAKYQDMHAQFIAAKQQEVDAQAEQTRQEFEDRYQGMHEQLAAAQKQCKDLGRKLRRVTHREGVHTDWNEERTELETNLAKEEEQKLQNQERINELEALLKQTKKQLKKEKQRTRDIPVDATEVVTKLAAP